MFHCVHQRHTVLLALFGLALAVLVGYSFLVFFLLANKTKTVQLQTGESKQQAKGC